MELVLEDFEDLEKITNPIMEWPVLSQVEAEAVKVETELVEVEEETEG